MGGGRERGPGQPTHDDISIVEAYMKSHVTRGGGEHDRSHDKSHDKGVGGA